MYGCRCIFHYNITNQLFLHDDLLRNFIAMRHKKARAAFVALANIESQKKLKLALNL